MGIGGHEKRYIKHICFISINDKKGIGFLCQIPKTNSNEEIKVLITNANFLPLSEIAPGKKIVFILNSNSYTLLIDESRKIYCNENDYNITIIEIKKEDSIESDSFFDIDLNENLTLENLKNKSISLITSQNKKIDVKKLNIKKLGIKEGEIEYTSDLKEKENLYGFPLIDTKNDKIIGIQKNYNEMNNICQGILLNIPIKEYLKPKIEKITENYELNEEEILKTKKSIKESIKKSVKESINSSKSSKNEKMENDIILTYLMPTNERVVKIFGTQFVQKNKDKAYLMLFDGVKNETYDYDLCEYINVIDIPEFKYKMKTFQVVLFKLIIL